MMKNERIWAFLIHLGSNMWAKKGTTWGRKLHIEEFGYKDEMFCDRKVWKQVVDFLPSQGFNTLVIDLGEGLLLDSHPEIATRGAWTKAELKEEILRLRDMGITCIPKYNFSTRHNAWMGEWAYRVGSPDYYAMCRDIIEEVIDLFDTPEFFHLGLEEEVPKQNDAINICRSPERKTADALELIEVCKGKGTRPWIWLDVDGFGGWKSFCERIPKDVLISTWHYGIIPNTGRPEDAPKEAYYIKELDEYGYQQIPTSSSRQYHLNSKETMIFGNDFCKNGTIIGYMTASWYLTCERRLYALLNDAYTFSWARRDVFGE